jgi:hypothetical protein
MFPAPGLEVPVNPMGHERALASIASVMIFFNASIILFFGIVYLDARAYSWQEAWDNEGWSGQRVIQWEWLLASVFMMGSFGAGVAGGIAAARATRFPLAMVSSVLLLVSSLILLWDLGDLMGETHSVVLFLLVLSLVPVALLVMARSGFSDPLPPTGGKGPPPYAVDNYGWSTMLTPDTTGRGMGPGGVGP